MSLNIKINENYVTLKRNYLFAEVAGRVAAYKKENPQAEVISLGIGDVTRPLPPAAVKALKSAADEMGSLEGFHGYAPDNGYPFLREAISSYYARRGIKIDTSEVFVSDGAKSDVGNIVDILGDNTVVIPDPVYPVYLDSNLMSGRQVEFISGSEENGFLPTPQGLSGEGYVIYLCSPNNPTGAVYDKAGLSAWVEFARKSGSLIIFDAAYEAFITDDKPHSIYEIEGARECAVEMCSFSKTAGFTGTRCAWSVFPNELTVSSGKLADLWNRRQATKFNGVPYVVQRAAEAVLSDEGVAQCRESVGYYLGNAKILAEALQSKDIAFTGGTSSPYLWLKCPNGADSWAFFDRLLSEAQLVGTPGAGFGKAGEGYFRLTSFGTRENTLIAAERLKKFL